MKRILILIKGLGRGGAEQLVANAAPYLDRSRFEYEVVYLLPHKNALVQALNACGLQVHCLDALGGLQWLRDLRGLVHDRRIDLVHAHLPFAGIGARLSLGFGRPCTLVYTEHNVWSSYRRPTYWANAMTFPANDYVFAVSHHVRESIRYPSCLRFLPHPKLETLYHGIDPTQPRSDESPSKIRSELGIPEGIPVVGTVGNLRREKGYEHFLLAAARVREQNPKARFVVVGDGPLGPHIRRRANELGFDGAMQFLGTRPDATRVMEVFDVFVLSSLYEGLSIALIEAMALGKPAVVTRVGGVPEVVHDGTHGFVVAPRQPNELAERVLTLLEDEPLRDRMGHEARRRAAHFDIRTAVRRMEQVYEELLA